MKGRRRWYLVPAGLAAVASLIAASFANGGTSGREATKVTLQLKWVTQAQFAGFYAAKTKGFYRQAGLDVNLKVGGPDISPEQVVAGKQAEFGINWLPSLLAQRDTGTNLVNIAQVYTRSGTTEVTWKDSGINTIKKMKGKKYGVWIL
jgi:NitT/TauT family transport system substrate-binding protein